MATLHDEVAREIAEALGKYDGEFDYWLMHDDIENGREAPHPPNIAAILEKHYGPVVEAVHSWLDEHIGISYIDDSRSENHPVKQLKRAAKSVNRWHDNGDGTVTVTERKESPDGK